MKKGKYSIGGNVECFVRPSHPKYRGLRPETMSKMKAVGVNNALEIYQNIFFIKYSRNLTPKPRSEERRGL